MNVIFSTDRSGVAHVSHHHHEFLKERADGYWRRAAIIGWMVSWLASSLFFFFRLLGNSLSFLTCYNTDLIYLGR